MTGQTINNYLIDHKLGEGGMGNVYIARHNRVDRIVAIKVLHQSLFANENIRNRFKNEANALIKLMHPNIVKIYDYVEQDDMACLIMEYIEGYTLDDYINKVSGPLPSRKAIHIISEVLEAVQYAHDHNIFHRDIKPGNIMLTRDGMTARIMDFGIAKFTDEANLKLTHANTQLGTPFYMSPEHVKGLPYTSLSDIYSLGVTLFEMVTGKCPYLEITNLFELQSKIVNEPLPPTAKYYPDVLPKIQDAINIATNKVPEQRFRNCNEFRKHLADEEKIKPFPILPFPVPAQSTNLSQSNPHINVLSTKPGYRPKVNVEKKANNPGIYLLIGLLLLGGCALFYFSNDPTPIIETGENLDSMNTILPDSIKPIHTLTSLQIDSTKQHFADSLIVGKESTVSNKLGPLKKRELLLKLFLIVKTDDSKPEIDLIVADSIIGSYFQQNDRQLSAPSLPTLEKVKNDLDGKILCNDQPFNKNTSPKHWQIIRINNGKQCQANLTFTTTNEEKCKVTVFYALENNEYSFISQGSEIIKPAAPATTLPATIPAPTSFCHQVKAITRAIILNDLNKKQLCETGDKISQMPKFKTGSVEYSGDIIFNKGAFKVFVRYEKDEAGYYCLRISFKR